MSVSFVFQWLIYLCRYANRAARFISAYAGGLTGADLKWVNKPYRGHRILPPSMIAQIKDSIAQFLAKK